MKNGRSLSSLAQELDRQLASKKDLVVPSPLLHFRTDRSGISLIDIDEPGGAQSYARDTASSPRNGVEIAEHFQSALNAR